VTAVAIQIVRILDDVPEGFEPLRREAAAEGYGFIDRLGEEVARGAYADNADLPVMLAAFSEGGLAALGGLTHDPYDPAPDLARIRHVYVRPAKRREGIDRLLTSALIQQGFALAGRLSLRAADARSAAFWDAQGFVRDDSSVTRTHLLARNGSLS
jgi:GNAT superfamily N-acetyltransferase